MSGGSFRLSLRPSRRTQALGLLVIGGALVSFVAPTTWPPTSRADQPTVDLASHAQSERAREVRERFEQAVVMLHARRFHEAVTALQRVVALSPRLPEAQANLGFAWLGLREAERAQQAFEAAIDLRANQANAYYGLAIALEQRGDLEAALGAMRSYLHLSRADDAHRSRARAAVWEWESRLGRHGAARPGPTREAAAALKR